MINVIFKAKRSFNTSPNELIPINQDYSFKETECAFGDLSKTNIFIGENNSGKSRFLRFLFKESFYSLDSQTFERTFKEYENEFKYSKIFDEKSCLLKFSFIYNEIKNKNTRYGYSITDFFAN